MFDGLILQYVCVCVVVVVVGRLSECFYFHVDGMKTAIQPAAFIMLM